MTRLAESIYNDMLKNGHSNVDHFYIGIRENVDKYLEEITNSYNHEIDKAQTLDEKINVIVKYIRQYEVLHPFRDANGRTFVNNLLNILLMQQGLPPATFYEPNVFDLYSTNELATVVKEAIFNTLDIIEKAKSNSPITLYGYSATESNTDEFKQLLNSPAYDELRKIDLAEVNYSQLEAQTQDLLSSLNELSPLHRAAVYPQLISNLVEQHISNINQHIEQGAPPIYVGKTPLHLAVMFNNLTMIDKLIENKADSLIQDYDGKNALHYAAEYGNVEALNKLLQAPDGKSLDAQDRQGKTALHYAAEFGNPKIIYLLVQALGGKNLDIKDNQGMTALHYAAERGNTEMVSALIKAGANLNERDKDGSTPITTAYLKKNLEIFDVLLDFGADISDQFLQQVGSKNDEAIFLKFLNKNKDLYFNKEAYLTAVKIGCIKEIEFFLNAGMSIDERLGKSQRTSLMVAVDSGNMATINYLLDQKADTNLTDSDGETILYHAITQAPNKEIIERIIAVNKDLIDKQNDKNLSPLHMIIQFTQNDELVKLLLDRGASQSARDMAGNTILHDAMQRNNIKMVDEIMQRDTNSALVQATNAKHRNPFHHAVREIEVGITNRKNKQSDLIKLYTKYFHNKIKLDEPDIEEKTILETALSRKFYDLYVHLLRDNAHTNISAASNYLKELQQKDIAAEDFEKNLLSMINMSNPVIAMAQLNDLYVQIIDDNITNPGIFSAKLDLSFFKSEHLESRKKLLDIVQNNYAKQLQEARQHNDPESLESMVKAQRISGSREASFGEKLKNLFNF